MAIDFLWNALFINRGDMTFIDVAPHAGADNAMNDMGVSLGDPDNDGDLDLYITNIAVPGLHNVLYRRQGAAHIPRFSEVSRKLTVDQGGWGWGCTFFDADNDGWQDIAATNGWFTPMFANDRSRLFWNPGDPRKPFAEVSARTGFNDGYWGSALIAFDVERDGDLDLMQSCQDDLLRLLANQPLRRAPHNWLVIRPRMPGPNSHAIGSIVRLECGNLRQMRPITAGTSYLGQEPAEAFFGTAQAPTVDRVVIEWPDGTRTCLHDVATNQVLTVQSGTRNTCANLSPLR